MKATLAVLALWRDSESYLEHSLAQFDAMDFANALQQAYLTRNNPVPVMEFLVGFNSFGFKFFVGAN